VLRLEEAVARPDETVAAERIDALRFAVDHGVNHINLGYPGYFANPEAACAYVRAALADGYREKVRTAVNIPSRGITAQSGLDKALDVQLGLFGLSKTDFCILDGVNRATWSGLKAVDIADWVRRAVMTGKTSFVGIAFHDDAYYLKEINDAHTEWAAVQMELSLLDYSHHPGVGGFRFTREYKNAVIATDCTKASRLLKNIPANVQEIWDRAEPGRTPAEWCVRWVLGFEEVASALIDFKSVDQVKEYMSYAENVEAGGVEVPEMLQAARVRDAYCNNRQVPCTACRCCMPCCLDIDVPRIVELYNDALMFADDTIPGLLYSIEGHCPAVCSECGACMKHCPKHFPLSEIVGKAQRLFTNRGDSYADSRKK